jgi:hypothetical protein
MALLSSVPSNALVGNTSGALPDELNSNLATTTGIVFAASGGALALGVGVAVAPGATLGLAAIGGSCIVAGNFDRIKATFSGTDKPVVITEDPAAVVKERQDLVAALTPEQLQSLSDNLASTDARSQEQLIADMDFETTNAQLAAI